MRKESEQAAAIVRERNAGASIDVGLVLGGGLASIAEQVTSPAAIPYRDLPGFIPSPSDPQGGELIIGTLGTARIGILKGRVAYHETGDIACMRVPIETLALLGAKAIVFANAAGSIKPEIRPGAMVVIRDHINLTGLNPLMENTGEKRLVDLAGAYDAILRERFQVAASDTGRKINEGVFMWFPGPSFETPAEIGAARVLGADLVGMSTVPEVIIARQLGLRVLAVAMVTNFAAGMADQPLGHEQTMRVAGATIVPLTRMLLKFFNIWVVERAAR